MQKRRYMDGFYYGSRKTTSDKVSVNKNFTLSRDNKFEVVALEVEDSELLMLACDTIYLKSGAKMIVKVNEVNEKQTSYNLCEGNDKSEFKLETKNLKRVCFASGKVDSLKSFIAENPKVIPVAKPVNSPNTNGTKKQVANACDTIFTRDGKKILCKVNGVYNDKTLYVLCNSDNQAEWDVETRTLKRICYGNGTIDSLKNQPAGLAPTHTFGTNQNEGFGNQKTKELDRAAKMANNAVAWSFASILFPYIGVVGYILAIIARKRLKDKRGYEKYYKKANIIFWIFTVLFGLALFMIVFGLLLLAII